MREKSFFYYLTPYSRELDSMVIEVIYNGDTKEVIRLDVARDGAFGVDMVDLTQILVKQFGMGLLRDIEKQIAICFAHERDNSKSQVEEEMERGA